MLARWKEPATFWRLLAAGASLSLALPVLFSPLDSNLAAARYWQVGLYGLAALWLLAVRPGSAAVLDAAPPRWAFAALAASGLAFFVACQVTMFSALRVNGIDFSIFDWMIHNAHQGKGMFSPIYGVNHLGVHQTWPLYLWVPLHALADSPWWLVISNAVLLWAGIFPLRALARALGLSEALGFLAVYAWLTNPWLGRVLDGSFHPESLYPAAGLYLAFAWVRGRALHLGLAALLYLAVKEDAAFHLLGLALGALLFARARRREALGLAAASVAVLALNLLYVQPTLLAPYGMRQPTYVSFWGQYGNTLGEIAAGMLSAPWRVASDILQSSWFKFFLPLLGLPLLTRVPLFAMLPVVFLLGSSSSAGMNEWRGYYPLPLVAFAIWAVLEVAARPSPRWRWAAVAALVGFATVGRGYARAVPLESHAAELLQLRQRVERHTDLVCTQTILFPQLGYGAPLVELSPECMADRRSLTVLHPALAPWPYRQEQLTTWIAAADAEERAEHFEGGYVVIRAASGDVATDGEPGGHRQ